ncbi:RDD family protein [Dactylosporangium sp. CA-139066]|uniref:RDD family protein n=1 Tax=Dactylosporangium sp. CA-139066 TaxID=3239930 RepID=UPI003D91C0AD
MAYDDGFRYNVHVTGRRVVATLIDGALFSCVSGGVAQANADASGVDVAALPTRTQAGLVVAAALYYIIFEGMFGWTIGKLITGIRVVDPVRGRPPGLGRALVRTALRLIDGILGYLLGFLVVLGSRNRRRLGDMAAGTLVVRN